MNFRFFKYQATGNDFVMIDNRNHLFPKTDKETIKKICDRRYGIGSDGLILIEDNNNEDFEMVFFNPDASQSLCGNGSRCAVKFAANLGLIKNEASFRTHDGIHTGSIFNGVVRLKMKDVHSVRLMSDGIFVDTGSPHYIQFVTNVKKFNVYDEGKKIRNSGLFGTNGTNVNFVEILKGNSIFVRTFERGVENETLSCGTGVTASALAASYKKLESPVDIITNGGELKVEYERNGKNEFTGIYLIGPTELVYEGTITL